MNCIPRWTAREWEYILPGIFDAPKCLPTRLQHRCDDARFFVGQVVWQMVAHRQDRWGYARLGQKVLRQVLTWRSEAPVKAALVDAGVIERDTHIQGERNAGYRLTDEYLQSGHIRQRPTCPFLKAKLAEVKRRIKADQDERRLPIHDKLHELQQRLTIRADAAAAIIAKMDTTKARFIQGVLVENIRRRRMTHSVCSTGRFFNAITGLSRQLRPALRLDGEPLASVDLRCCQPSLLSALVTGRTPPMVGKGVATYKVSLESSLSPSNQRLYEQCSQGVFFDEFSRECGVSRDFAKQRFIVDVLAKKGSYRSHVQDVFTALYPDAAKFILSVNRGKDNHGRLICLLQRLESWLVVETVAPLLVDSVPIITLHDAIFAKQSDIESVKDAFQQTFDEIGFSMQLKTELW